MEIIIALFLMLFSFSEAVANDRCVLSIEDAVPVIDEYLDNSVKRDFRINYKLLSDSVREDWYEKGIKNMDDYEGEMSATERRVISFVKDSFVCSSSDQVKVVVTVSEYLDGPEKYVTTYWFELKKELHSWKINRYGESGGKYMFLP